jgi:cell division protein FtsL
MNRIVPVLAGVVMISAILAVTARHKARVLFQELRSEQKQSRDIEVEWERLLLEQASWGKLDKIEAAAQGHLQMSMPSAGQIRVLPPPGVAP